MKRPNHVGSTIAITTAVICLTPRLAFSEIIAQDTFETYTLGPLSGQGGGIGWTGNWTSPAGSATVVSGTSLAAQNATLAVNSGQITASRQLGASLSTSFFVGFMLQYSGTSVFDGNDTFSLYMSSGATTVNNSVFTIGARSANGTPTFMVRKGTGSPVAGGSTTLAAGAFPSGETHLLVAQYVWDGANFSTINGWLDPGFGESASPQITETLADPSTGLTSIGYAFVRNYDGNNDDVSPNDFWTVDNLVVATSWADVVSVVPEPSSIALLGLGSVALCLVRRRN